jgi:hypothetical protein
MCFGIDIDTHTYIYTHTFIAYTDIKIRRCVCVCVCVCTHPGPMPTFTTSAPERMSSSVISPVTTLPATMVAFGWASRALFFVCVCVCVYMLERKCERRAFE